MALVSNLYKKAMEKKKKLLNLFLISYYYAYIPILLFLGKFY
jgi:hypothetical protein